VDVADVIKALEQTLRSDFERLSGSIEHRPAKGRWREASVVEAFLAKHLVGNVRVAHGGEIITTDGDTSGECDIVIYDADVRPILTSAAYSVFPVEIVYGVIEVKSKLTTKELESAVAKLSAIKRLTKRAFLATPVKRRPRLNLYGESLEDFPIFTFIFAYDSIDLTSIGSKLDELQEGVEPRYHLDGIWVLDKGYFSYVEGDPTKGGGCRASLTSTPETGAIVVKGGALTHMAAYLQTIFQYAWQPGFKILSYMGEADFGTVTAVRKPRESREDG
jgi:hypothetical protein